MFGALLGIVAGAVALRQMLSIVPEPAFFMAVAMLAASPRFLRTPWPLVAALPGSSAPRRRRGSLAWNHTPARGED